MLLSSPIRKLLHSSAYLWHEGYAASGMEARPSNSTAYPDREENYLMLLIPGLCDGHVLLYIRLGRLICTYRVFFSEVPERSGLSDAAEAWAENRRFWNAGQ